MSVIDPLSDPDFWDGAKYVFVVCGDGSGTFLVKVPVDAWAEECAIGVAYRTSTDIATRASLNITRETIGGH